MILFALFGAQLALATPTTDLIELATIADSVVRGKVLTTRTQRESENTYTVATIRVLETLRGPPRPVVEVRLPGAMLDDKDLQVHGQAKLIEGYEVLLFLKGDQLVDMGAGAFVVIDGQAWRSEYAWTYVNPKTVGKHVESYYVSHELEAVRSSLR
jgi:hypothetical protein